MRSSNPVLTRLTPVPQAGYRAGAAQRHRSEARPATVLAPAETERVTAEAERMTIDDVVVRTAGLLALTGITATLAWSFVPDEYLVSAWIGAALVGVVAGLVITFARVTNPVVISGFAIVEGVFVGLVSKYYESFYDGIVMQAAIGSFGVFFLMAMLYKSRVIRATPTFIRGVVGATVGVFAIILVNFLLALFTDIDTGLRDGSPLAIGFSLVVIVIASLNFILDFHMVEEGIRLGMPQRFAWLCAVGILIGLVWLYIEILRLLSYLRGEN